MADDWQFYRVFIAGPGDTKRHCTAVAKAVSDWNEKRGRQDRVLLLHGHWSDLAPNLSAPPQETIDRSQLIPADLLIAVFAKRPGQYTQHELDKWRSLSRGAHAMVYFPSPCPRPLLETQRRMWQHGLVGTYTSVKGLTRQLTSHLSQQVSALSDASTPIARLRRARAALYKAAPVPLANILESQPLSDCAESLDEIAQEAKQLEWNNGLIKYQTFVHGLLDAPEWSGATVLAVCGNKGLEGQDDNESYFNPFYIFADRTGGSVFRAFICDSLGDHSADTSRVIEDHNRQRKHRRVRGLHIDLNGRTNINRAWPGFCDDLDRGFGVLLLVHPKNAVLGVIHQDIGLGLRYARFQSPHSLRPLGCLIDSIYGESKKWSLREAPPHVQQFIRQCTKGHP